MSDVTLYIPVYNAARFLEEVLPATFRLRHPPSELLIVDDASTDASMELVGRLVPRSPFPVRILPHGRNLGLGAARNTALREAKTPFLAAIDSDVVLEPDWLERVMAAFDAPAVGGVGGNLLERHVLTAGDRWRDTFMRQSHGERARDVEGLFGSNTVFRTEVLRRAGGYNERCRTNGEDADLSRRVRASGQRLVYAPEARCHHLRRDDSLSIMNTFWRWLYYFKYDERPTFGRLLKSSLRNFLDLRWTTARCLQARRIGLVPLALAMPFYRTYKDWSAYLSTLANGRPA